MPMSDGKHKLQKIAFQIGNTFFRFAINPESLIDSRPHRTTAVKTKSRIVIEDFQSDIPTITITGSTGFNPTGKAEDRGIAKIKALKKFLADFAEQGGNGNTDAQDLYFHNFTNDESWVVVLSQEGVTYTQDVSSPLTYKYEIKFTVLRPANMPDDSDVVNPEIGNSTVSIHPGPGGPQNADPTQSNKPNAPSGGYTGINGKPITGTSPGSFTPDSGNSASGNGTVFNQSTGSSQVTTQSNPVVNPQAPSATSYRYGQTALGYLTGYYARGLSY